MPRQSSKHAELVGKVLHSVAKEAGLGNGSIKKTDFVCVPHLSQVQPEMAFLDYQGSPLTQDPRSDCRCSESKTGRHAQFLHYC